MLTPKCTSFIQVKNIILTSLNHTKCTNLYQGTYILWLNEVKNNTLM